MGRQLQCRVLRKRNHRAFTGAVNPQTRTEGLEGIAGGQIDDHSPVAQADHLSRRRCGGQDHPFHVHLHHPPHHPLIDVHQRPAGKIPALFTNTSSRPKSSTHRATMASIWSGSPTSTAIATTRPDPGNADRRTAASVAASALRSAITTSAPASRKRAQQPKPIPRASSGHDRRSLAQVVRPPGHRHLRCFGGPTGPAD